MAFSAKLLQLFPPYDVRTPWIDDALGHRALMCGKCVEIPNKLLYYRIHTKNTSSDGLGSGRKRLRFIRQRWLDYLYAIQHHYLGVNKMIRVGSFLALETCVCLLNMSHFYRWLRGRK